MATETASEDRLTPSWPGKAVKDGGASLAYVPATPRQEDLEIPQLVRTFIAYSANAEKSASPFPLMGRVACEASRVG